LTVGDVVVTIRRSQVYQEVKNKWSEHTNQKNASGAKSMVSGSVWEQEAGEAFCKEGAARAAKY